MSRIYSPDWLNELKGRCDIVDVISHYVPLKKAGREFCGCCPFHHEKNGSFYVYPSTQSFHCFGCKESGDVVNFVRKYENLSFMDAVEKLANMVNMPLPKLQGVSEEEIMRKKQEKNQILQALREAGMYYHKNLYTNHPQAKIALNYIEKRQISPEYVRKFGLGISLDYQSLLDYMQKKGFSLDTLKKAGLVTEVEGRVYDAFGKRLTFPIFNKDGQVIGFSARILENKDTAKYKNTTATPVFNKSEVIFAINLLEKQRKDARAKGEDSNLDNILIVEGQIDVISMHQFGFENTVACLGTALTPIHARKLKQLSENIILLLDGDGAGKKATLRSIDVLRSYALNVKVASLPNGMDPDEFLKANGSDALREILDNAVDGIEYKIKVLLENYDLTVLTQKSKFVHEALVVIKGLEEQSMQDIYLELVRKYSSIPVEVLRMDLANINDTEKPYWEREQEEVAEEKVEEKLSKDAYTMADLHILASILYNKDYIMDFLDRIKDLQFYDKGLCEAYGYIRDELSHNVKPNLSGLYSFMDVDESTPALKEVCKYEFLPDPLPEITFESYLYKNEERKIKKLSEDLQNQCATTRDIGLRNSLMTQIIDLTKQLNVIKQEIEKLNAKYATNLNLYSNKGRK